MKLTVVTNDKGKILASMLGHASEHRRQPGPFATLQPGPEQVFHEIDVPDDYQKLSPDDLHRMLQKHVDNPTAPY
jgi:hypothetical protein